jgi:hypothetical protein
MKKTIKYGIVVFLLSLSSLTFAFDTGFEFSNTAGWKDTGNPDGFTDHKATLWLTVPFNRENTNSLAVEGSVYASKPAKDNFRFFLDLDLFRLSLVPYAGNTAKIAMDAGRLPVSDVTGFILNQTVDGADLHAAFKFGNANFTAGYTGLLNARKGGALMSVDDYEDTGTNAIYKTGSSHAIGKLTIQLPQLIGSSDLIFEATGQYDMRRKLQADPDELVDTAYGTLQLSGPVTNTLFYSVSGIFQTGVMTEKIAANSGSINSILGSARFDFYPAVGNQLNAQITFSPGENNFFSVAGFLPITFQSAGTLFTEGNRNLTKISLGWNCNPLKQFNFDVGSKFFMYAKTPDGSQMFRGTEATAGATIKATSDVKFRLDSAILFMSNEKMKYQASLKAIITL